MSTSDNVQYIRVIMVLLGDTMSTLGDIVRTSEATTIHVVGYDEHILRCSVYWGDVLSSPGDVLLY